MNILIILIPIAFIFSFSFLIAFLWSVRSGQFKDLQTPAMKILFEEKNIDKKTLNKKGTSQ